MTIKIDFRPFTLTMMGLALVGFAFPAYAESPETNQQKPNKGEHLKRMSEKLDTNKDGSISKGEFLTSMEERFNEMDSDGSGEITQEELKAHHKNKREKMKEKFEKMKSEKDNASN